MRLVVTVAFTTAFDDDAIEPQARRELLREAVTVHRARGRESGSGYGVDRHLFSIYSLLAEDTDQEVAQEAMALMYGDAWAKHQKSILSTSNCSVFGPSIVCPGFGAVCDDGYGLGYCIQKGCIDICITNYTGDPGTGGAGFGGVVQEVQEHSFDTDAIQFGEELSTALRQIRELVLSTSSSS